MVTAPGSLKDWERETGGGGGGGEGAALLLLFRAARWDHCTFRGSEGGDMREMSVEQTNR